MAAKLKTKRGQAHINNGTDMGQKTGILDGNGQGKQTATDLPLKTNQMSGQRAGFAFLLVFILLAAGIVVTGWLYYRNYKKQFRAGIERQLSVIADLKAGDLAQYRKERLEDGSTFLENAPFAALVRRFLEKPEKFLWTILVGNTLANFLGFIWFFFFDLLFRIRYILNPAELANIIKK